MRPEPPNRSIKDFFKPFTIPKSGIPKNDVIEEEIVVASPKAASSSSSLSSRQPSASPFKQTTSRRSSARSSNVSTPTKRAKKRLWPAQVDGVSDDALIHVSPSSSQQREMTAVEIPSQQAAPSLPPEHVERDAPTRSAATSFSSISTLSSIPSSTQSSSRRVVKHGMQAVTNSDSGSADSDSDELADPSTFIARKRRKTTPPGQDVDHAIEIMDTIKPARQSKRLSDKDKRSSTASTPRLPLSPPRTVYKHSLLNMVKQREREEKTEIRIKETESAFEQLQRKRAEQMRRENGLDGGFKAATADDSDEGERMMLAMARTEALQDEEKFYFFRKGPPIRSEAIPPVQSEDGVPFTLWNKVFRIESSRTHAFLTGFVAEIAWREPLPEELCEWIITQLVHESRADLCEAYVETLRAQASHPFKRPFDIFTRLSCFYGALRSWSVTAEDTVRFDSFNNDTPRPENPPMGLQHVLHAVRYCCRPGFKDPETVAFSVLELILAGIDEYVGSDAALKTLASDSIEHILESIRDTSYFEETCKCVCRRFFAWERLSFRIRCRAIASQPATSARCHRLRRLLAVHLVSNRIGEEQYKSDLTSSEWVDIILLRLKRAPEFAISEATDYAQFNPLIEVLDIAIDSGFSDFAFLTPDTEWPESVRDLAKSFSASAAETAFNSQIDAITSQLQLMGSRIRDAGTSHLRRTEAKSAIERLVVRLEHGVRTKPKPRKGIFGAVTGEQRSFLSGFLKQAEKTIELQGDTVSIVPVDLLSDREDPDASDASEGSAVSGAGAP